MVVDVGFTGMNRVAGPIAQRKRSVAVNLSGDAMRQHERAMEYRREMVKLNSDLDAAMASLASSNAEIDRLNAKIAELEYALRSEQEKNARLSAQTGQQKQTRKSRKDKAEEEQSPEQND